ncbi:thermonuclease family protein [Sphingobium sp. 3R8]|uniref:thermonuclease family protein n=1 Tax=Sphingobium sp. 3R8 TaxID=2874921 RepID=UPI001CCCBDF3|nr:thermonuclease family protein [Sphingobium sp. 3R8]MBZ9648152.1 thermonuclease family protein [Sphingobium sp. 3R8]
MPIVPFLLALASRANPPWHCRARFVLLALAATAAPATLARVPDARVATGTVRTVTDGDTFRLTSGERIRIAGIDAPETQAQRALCPAERRRGEAAKARLTTMIAGRSIRFTRVGRSYNRTVATVRHGGHDLATRLVESGDARWWPRGKTKPDWCQLD